MSISSSPMLDQQKTYGSKILKNSRSRQVKQSLNSKFSGWSIKTPNNNQVGSLGGSGGSELGSSAVIQETLVLMQG